MTAPRRRWPRFSLRTLLVVVTVSGAWIGWNLNVVSHRQRLLEWSRMHGGDISTRQAALDHITVLRMVGAHEGNAAEFDDVPDVPPIRRLLGDEAIAFIGFAPPPPVDMRAQLQAWFPETLFDYEYSAFSTGEDAFTPFRQQSDDHPGRFAFPTLGARGGGKLP
jgi:hypothetical protein